MRISTKILAAAAALVLAGAQPAPAAPHRSAGVVPALTALTVAPATHGVTVAAAPTQDAKIDVNISSTEKGAWYTQPIWIAIGVIALVVIILLAVVAGRRNTTTVVK